MMWWDGGWGMGWMWLSGLLTLVGIAVLVLLAVRVLGGGINRNSPPGGYPPGGAPHSRSSTSASPAGN